MTDLPVALRDALDSALPPALEPVAERSSDADQTTKWSFRLDDGAVFLEEPEGTGRILTGREFDRLAEDGGLLPPDLAQDREPVAGILLDEPECIALRHGSMLPRVPRQNNARSACLRDLQQPQHVGSADRPGLIEDDDGRAAGLPGRPAAANLQG